jgi:Protein of unknown function (DUF1579)
VTDTSSEAMERLAVLVGRWHTEGWTRDEAGHQAERIDAIDSYDWLSGGAAVLHLVEATVGERTVEGAEIIGYDPDRGHYATQYFGTDGPTAYDASLSEADDGARVWEMRSEDTRFRGSFNAGGSVITGRWERLAPDAGWQPWMDITLTKES